MSSSGPVTKETSPQQEEKMTRMNKTEKFIKIMVMVGLIATFSEPTPFLKYAFNPAIVPAPLSNISVIQQEQLVRFLLSTFVSIYALVTSWSYLPAISFLMVLLTMSMKVNMGVSSVKDYVPSMALPVKEEREMAYTAMVTVFSSICVVAFLMSKK